MPLIQHRINLDSPTFPFLSEFEGRTVIVNGSDRMVPGVNTNPPQVYYAHNVLPTPYGYQSIAYDQFIPSTVYTDFIAQVTIRETLTGNAATMGITKSGKVLVSTLRRAEWEEIGIGSLNLRDRVITSAFVKGITYIYFSKLGCYTYDFVHKTLSPVTLIGLDATKVLGIVASQGYMLAFGVGNAIAWSSPITPVDFTPSLNTGAGAGILEGAQGETVAGLPVQGGVIFLNGSNATSATYQANGSFPFRFDTIVGCGGLSSPLFASYSALDSQAAYAYTTSGLQAITLREATFLSPQVTEFLSGRRLEDFDEATLQFNVTTPTNVIKKRLAWVADRYLIISYGDELLTHAIVIDLALGRMGKLKIDHVAVFEFSLFDQTLFETPKRSIGILKANGQIVVVNADIAATASSGVLLLGKYQYVRERTLQLQFATFENIPNKDAFTLYDMVSLDGKTLGAPSQGFDTGNTGLSRQYNFHSVGVNHSLLAKGRFNLVSGVLGFNIHGKR